jgi:RNA recognition motif-containing protein
MNKRLYVGNLNYAATDEDLRALFDEVGDLVAATVIVDRDTGRSKGFGFVEFATEEGAQKAIDTYNDTEMQGRNITVAEARPRRNRNNSYGGGGGGSSYGGGSNSRW